jgi:hypothetical protein
MRKLAIALCVLAALGVAGANAQGTAKPAPAPTVKALQPGLLEVTGPRVGEAAAVGIQKISARTGKGRRNIEVHSPWGESYFDWPAGVKPMPFEITAGKGGTATISAPGFSDANKADYRAAVEAIVPTAIKMTQDNRNRQTMKQ